MLGKGEENFEGVFIWAPRVKDWLKDLGLYILAGDGAMVMKEELKGKIFHWVERALALDGKRGIGIKNTLSL